MLEQFDKNYAAQDRAIKQKDAKIKALKSENWMMSNDNDNLRGEVTSLQTANDHLGQWAKKWQHDAHRSFIKVMFGSGKAPVPDVPRPQIE